MKRPRRGGWFLCTVLLGGGNLAVFGAADEASVVVTADRPRANERVSLFGAPADANELPVSVSVLTAENIRERQPDRIEEALLQTGAVVPSVNQAGLNTALNARGFDLASRLQYNGYPDFQRMFVRDLGTVERIEVLKGHLSLLYGSGTPGATINYVGKRPAGSGTGTASLGLGSFGMRRVEFDLDSKPGLFDYRLVFAGQHADTGQANVGNERQAALAGLAWRYGNGSALRAELEGQRNHRPFSFGTVYVNGQFLFDRSYVGPQARSDRRYGRAALLLDHAFDPQWSLHAAHSTGHVNRDERLVGFWTIDTPTTLSGYFRDLSDHYRQRNTRLELRGFVESGTLLHRLSAGLQRDSQRFDFVGPQNIGGFSLDVDSPNFDLDLAALPLSPRFSRERYVEAGRYLLDRISVGEAWHVLAGVRRSDVRLDTGNATALRRATEAGHTDTALGVLHVVWPGVSIYASRTGSFEPNRGADRFGNFVPPRQARQHEAGLRADGKGDGRALEFALFDIEQTNLTTSDPLDRAALLAVGTVRSRGVELGFRQPLVRGFALTGQFAWQRVRNAVKTDPTLGDELPGVPSRYGALGVQWAGTPGRAWASVALVGRRPGDVENSFAAPGYARLDVGATAFLARDTELTGSIANLLDKRYVEALTAADNVYQGERRRVLLTLRQRW